MSFKSVSVEDFTYIFNMMGAYQYMVDEGDEEGWSDLFTEDGAFIGLPEELGPPESFRGREGLKKIPRMNMQFYGGKFRHFMGSFSVQYGATRDEAFTRYYVLGTTWMKDPGPKLDQFVIVRTHLVRIDGEWKIKSNTMSPI